MNKLEALLTRIKAYNAMAAKAALAAKALADERETIAAEGRKIGLNVSDVRRMLAFVNVRVRLPDEVGGEGAGDPDALDIVEASEPPEPQEFAREDDALDIPPLLKRTRTDAPDHAGEDI